MNVRRCPLGKIERTVAGWKSDQCSVTRDFLQREKNVTVEKEEIFNKGFIEWKETNAILKADIKTKKSSANSIYSTFLVLMIPAYFSEILY